MTLPDGAQLEAAVPPDGEARIALPADWHKRVEREGNRRATLEVIGDAGSQVRLEL